MVLETASPAAALRRVNDFLLPDTQQGMFVTAVYGELDLALGTFTYVNAGHNPPFWVKNDGSLEKLTRTSIALGVMEQPGHGRTYPDHCVGGYAPALYRWIDRGVLTERGSVR